MKALVEQLFSVFVVCCNIDGSRFGAYSGGIFITVIPHYLECSAFLLNGTEIKKLPVQMAVIVRTDKQQMTWTVLSEIITMTVRLSKWKTQGLYGCQYDIFSASSKRGRGSGWRVGESCFLPQIVLVSISLWRATGLVQ